MVRAVARENLRNEVRAVTKGNAFCKMPPTWRAATRLPQTIHFSDIRAVTGLLQSGCQYQRRGDVAMHRQLRKDCHMGLILLIILILLLIGGIPTWPHSRNWGYGPSGVLSVVLIIVIVMVLMGYIPRGF